MSVRNQDREAIERLESKTLDARFTTEIQQGLNSSPFEAEAVLDVVKEVYFPFLSSQSPQGTSRPTKQIRHESSRDQRAVKTNFAACPRPLWVKVVRLPGLADGEDVADWIPRVVGDRVGDETREAVGGELQALVEATVVIDLNSIVDAPSE